MPDRHGTVLPWPATSRGCTPRFMLLAQVSPKRAGIGPLCALLYELTCRKASQQHSDVQVPKWFCLYTSLMPGPDL